MRPAATLACAALLAAAPWQDAAAIVRCEDDDGKVTYSNNECPPNTRVVRKVEPSPPVVVNQGAASGASSPGATAPAAQPPATRSARARHAEPAEIDRELTAQLAEQRRECDARAREIQRLQADVDSAAPPARAAADLALRRAQHDYLGLCPRRR